MQLIIENELESDMNKAMPNESRLANSEFDIIEETSFLQK